MKKEVYLITKREYGGCQRKLAWFKRYKKDIYFNVFGFFRGSHISYHESGGIFITNPALSDKARKIGHYLPLDDFKGWHQIGTNMILKSELLRSPVLSKRERKKAVALKEVDLEAYPSEVMNIVVEFLEPNKHELLESENVQPPKDATVFVIDAVQPWIVLTVLGHKHNLLIEPIEDGFAVHHFNTRYSTNRPGVQYQSELRR